MASLSQALLLGYLPSPHSAFQEHAAHPIEWSMALSSKGSSGTCIPEVLRHSSILLSRRSRTSPSSWAPAGARLAVVTPSDTSRDTSHAPARPGTRGPHRKRSPSPRREAGVGLVHIGHIA